ncbi:hypothetical protein DUNSADRAFT_13265 [Dunaliella salina]|uniref:Protein kinase domain-containing protein n=1 Tax=Dunaliella salina TaxID=3046 RepID=A0ABQ7G9T2_DUNSA|nr:hypothetical protein DUNSADRAFT_13265 [Dunaliella salina]|eukprot:KAF5831358.1 hypothetical protein DUNSADRAFT_13265 [Dunaliella salina]
MTHMAPEVLLEGRVSKAADVYAFGITLWELFTAGQPYKGVPMALLGHRVVKEQRRPALPLAMPEGYRELLNKCWAHKPEHRPTFLEILEQLRVLRNAQPFPTHNMSRIARLDVHPIRATVLQKLAEDARIDEGAEEGIDSVEGQVLSKPKAQALLEKGQSGRGLREGMLERGKGERGYTREQPERGNATCIPHSPGMQSRAGQGQSWWGLIGTGHPLGDRRRDGGCRPGVGTQGGQGDPGERGIDSGGGRGGAGGAGAQGCQGHKGLAFPGAVVLDMRQVAEGMRAVGDRSSCSGVEGVRGSVGSQTGGGGPAAVVQGREGQPQGGGGATPRRKSYPGLQCRRSFAEQQHRPGTQSDKDPSQVNADTHKSDPGLMRDTPSSSKPYSFASFRTPRSPHSMSSSSSRHLRFSHSSRSRSSQNCVLVIGDDDDFVYPENSRGQGEGEGSAQSFCSTKVEVSAMRTKGEGAGRGRGRGRGKGQSKGKRSGGRGRASTGSSRNRWRCLVTTESSDEEMEEERQRAHV